jgi:hypothetical protein
MTRSRVGHRLVADGDGLSLSAMALLAGLGGGLLAQGAYYGTGQLLLGAAVALSAGLSLSARRGRASGLFDVPVGAAIALAGWALLRGAVGSSPVAGVRVALLALCVAVTLVVVRRLSGSERGDVLHGLLAAGALVALTGWAGVVWHVEPLALTNDGVWRATSTLTYANATAAVLGPLALVTAGDLVRRGRDPLLATALAALLIGTLATLSRAGLLALAVGSVLLVVLHGPGRVLRATLPPCLGAALAFAGLVPSMPAGSDAGRPGAIAGLAAGVAATALLSRVDPRRLLRWAAPAVLLGALTALATGSLLQAGAEVAGWRANASSPARTDAAAAALRLVTEHPVLGAGPGDGWVRWREDDGTRATMRYVHNEYLQVWVDLGLPGLLFLGAVLLGAAAALREAWRAERRAGLVAGGAAAFAAAAAHAALDFVWHVPVVPLLLAALVALACGTGGSTSAQPATEEMGWERETDHAKTPRLARGAGGGGGGAGGAGLGSGRVPVPAAVLAGAHRFAGHVAGEGSGGVRPHRGDLPERGRFHLAGRDGDPTIGERGGSRVPVDNPALHG